MLAFNKSLAIRSTRSVIPIYKKAETYNFCRKKGTPSLEKVFSIQCHFLGSVEEKRFCCASNRLARFQRRTRAAARSLDVTFGIINLSVKTAKNSLSHGFCADVCAWKYEKSEFVP